MNGFSSRDDYLDNLSSSDLSVEELLASGADVGDLVSAGVLHDDYPAGHDFTEEEPEPQKYDGPPRTEEETRRLIERLKWNITARRLGKDAPPRPV